MGSNLSRILSNLFMEYFESELVPKILNIKWLRYVDDIFLIWPHGKSFDDFFEKLNELHPSIKFKCEWEHDGKLPFLDTTVINNGFNLIFDIYRKPTNSLSYIHILSRHKDKVKHSVILSQFLRAYNIWNYISIDNKIKKIEEIFTNLGYPNYFIKKAHTVCLLELVFIPTKNLILTIIIKLFYLLLIAGY